MHGSKEIDMNSIHSDRPDRILSEKNRNNIYRISSVIRCGFVGAFLAFSIFAILSMFGLGSVTLYFGSTLIDPEAVWSIFGAVTGLIIGLIVTSFFDK